MKSATALYIGRFQPLHKGHVYALKKLFQKYRKVIIVVGSTNKKDEKNPFGFGERKSMLAAALKKYKGRYKTLGMPDFSRDDRWTKEVIRRAEMERSNIVVTHNPWTKRCFAGYKIVKPALLNPKKYNATGIRKLIRQEKNWQSLVPEGVIPIIRKHFSKP